SPGCANATLGWVVQSLRGKYRPNATPVAQGALARPWAGLCNRFAVKVVPRIARPRIRTKILGGTPMLWPFSLFPGVRNSRPPVRRPPRAEELEARVLLTNHVYLAPGQAGQTVAARFDLLSRPASARDEVGIVRLDDVAGHVGGLAPGDAGYAAAALTAAR